MKPLSLVCGKILDDITTTMNRMCIILMIYRYILSYITLIIPDMTFTMIGQFILFFS